MSRSPHRPLLAAGRRASLFERRSASVNRILTYDSTLRDGEQCEGITLSLEDKLRIVERLDAFGVDFIEGGFPASNPKDIAFFQRVQEMPLKHARIAAFGSTCKKDVAAEDDRGLADLVASGAPVVTIVGKTWDEQVTRALLTTLDENLRMIRDSVAYLKAQGLTVVFDAEHFFDGYKANADYAMACARAASEAGADSIDLCETNGGALPHEVEAVVAAVARELPGQQLGIHCHNDSGCAVANSLAAVRAGATQVQGTVNGFGERVGNTDPVSYTHLDVYKRQAHHLRYRHRLRRSVRKGCRSCSASAAPRRRCRDGDQVVRPVSAVARSRARCVRGLPDVVLEVRGRCV